jgi:hypothetical protein
MNAWLIEFDELDGNDAQLLVEGLGLEDLDHMDILPLPDAARIAEAIGSIKVPGSYVSDRVAAILERNNRSSCA